MKLIQINQLLLALSLALGLSSCTTSYEGGHAGGGGGGGYDEGYALPQQRYAPQGRPVRRMPPPGYGAPQGGGYQGDGEMAGGPEEQPQGRMTRTLTGRNHFNGRLRNGQVIWTLNGAPVSASQVPAAAKEGFERGLRARGYTGSIEHASNAPAPAPLSPPMDSLEPLLPLPTPAGPPVIQPGSPNDLLDTPGGSGELQSPYSDPRSLVMDKRVSL